MGHHLACPGIQWALTPHLEAVTLQLPHPDLILLILKQQGRGDHLLQEGLHWKLIIKGSFSDH